MTTSLFVYGSLQFPRVMRAVTGRDYASSAAVLDGYARYLVRNATYPGLTESSGERTSGVIYHGLTPEAMKALDRFEGDLYERRLVEVETPPGRRERAWTYVIRESRRGVLSDLPWDGEEFKRHHLDGFLSTRQW